MHGECRSSVSEAVAYLGFHKGTKFSLTASAHTSVRIDGVGGGGLNPHLNLQNSLF